MKPSTAEDLIAAGRLVEVEVPGTPYKLLGPATPGQYLTIPERVVIARRLNELDGKLPKYVMTRRNPERAESAAAREGENSAADLTLTHPEGEVMNTSTTETKSEAKPEKSAEKSDTVTMSGRQFLESKGVKRPAKKPAAKKPAAKPAAKKPAAKDTDPKAHVAGVSAAKAKGNGGFDDEQKISWLVKENPRRGGSDTHRRFAKYFGSKTVGEYFKKGGTAGDLRWDVKHKYLTVSK